MKITLEKFESLLESGTWTHESECEVVGDQTIPAPWSADYPSADDEISVSWGWAHCTSTCQSDVGEIRIVYRQDFQYEDYEPDTLEPYDSSDDEVWSLVDADGHDVTVIDADGDELDISTVDDWIFVALPDAFSDIDYSGLDIAGDAETIDRVPGADEWTIDRSNAPYLHFTGVPVARAKRGPKTAYLYRTARGRYVANFNDVSVFRSSRNTLVADVFDTQEAAVEWVALWSGSLAADLEADLAALTEAQG